MTRFMKIQFDLLDGRFDVNKPMRSRSDLEYGPTVITLISLLPPCDRELPEILFVECITSHHFFVNFVEKFQ